MNELSDACQSSTPSQSPSVTGLWIGDSLPPLAELCIRSFQGNGFRFRLLTYGSVQDIPPDVEVLDARDLIPETELFTHTSGSLAPTADRIRYKYLANHGGLWTDMDVACLQPFSVPADPWFALQEPGIANLAVLSFPPGHPVMKTLEAQMADPAAPMPWDDEQEIQSKMQWRKNVPAVKNRQMHAEWSLGGPEGFTRALKHYGIFSFAAPQNTFNPVHYTGWRWNFDGTLYEGHELFRNTLAVHLWAELLRREPDALDYASPNSIVRQLMKRYDCDRNTKSGARASGQKKPAILVGICSCRKYKDKRQSIRETWLSKKVDGVTSLFFVGGTGKLDSDEDEDTVVVNETTDNYQRLPEKVRAFFSYALDHSDFEWLFKCDDDTYVALDRLHELIDDRVDIVGSPYLAERGSPSGGAGYLLSRDLVSKLVADSSLSTEGDEDVIHGEAAIRYGARPSATARLRMDAAAPIKKNNDLITAHWCSIERMHALHAIYVDDPASKVEVEHSHWRDTIKLHANHSFNRVSTNCYGRWHRDERENLVLNWFDWPGEVFTLSRPANLSDIDIPAADHPYVLCGPASSFRDTKPDPIEGRVLLHIGCGPNSLRGWHNVDLPQIDIRDNLPYLPASADAIFLEHVIEHVSPQSAFLFMREAHRVLKRGGVLRLAFPDVTQIARTATSEYRRFLLENGWSDGSKGSEIASIVLNHGHQGVWSRETMTVLLESLGFKAKSYSCGQSDIPLLSGIEKHGSQIGGAFNEIETCCIEAHKT